MTIFINHSLYVGFFSSFQYEISVLQYIYVIEISIKVQSVYIYIYTFKDFMNL
jgi:hypothetical protein